jgi:Tol biopolymer transport system component
MKAIHNLIPKLFMAVIVTMAPLASYAQERIAFQSNRDGNQEVYTMKTDGTNQLRLTNNSAFDGEPAFGAGGSKLVFTSTRDGNADIYIMNPDGTDQKRVTTSLAQDTHPALSPDGTKIAFISSRAGGLELFVMNADGSNPTQLTFTATSEFNPSFSPDGSKILYSGFDSNDPEIYIINVDGTNNVNLTDNSADDRNASFSPDGSRIVYELYDNANFNYDIAVMNADGSGQTNITNSIASYDTAPSYSPDGQHITYTSNGEICVMTYGGVGEIAITDGGTNVANQNSTWSPANDVPLLEDVSVDAVVNEGGVAKVTGVIADDNTLDSHSIAVSWGDGLPTYLEIPAGTTSFEATHVYVDDAPVGTASDDFEVLVSINDHRYGFDNVTKNVTVKNVNPELSNLSLTPSTITVGKAFRLRGDFADPGYHGSVNDEGLTVTIAFDDGQTNVSNNTAPGVIDIFHTYQTVGNHTITVKVTDNDLGVTIQTIPVVVSPPPAPSAPANVRIDYIAANRVQLAWTDSSDNEDGFVIERCTNRGCSNFAQVGQTGANASVYLDNNLFANTQYYYRVKAFNLGGSSVYSDVVSAKTLKK